MQIYKVFDLLVEKDYHLRLSKPASSGDSLTNKSMFLYVKRIMRAIDEYSENYYRLVMIKSPGAGSARESAQPIAATRKELVSTHNGRVYRLRITQNGS